MGREAEARVGLELEELRNETKADRRNFRTEFQMVALQNLCTDITVWSIPKNVINQLLISHL